MDDGSRCRSRCSRPFGRRSNPPCCPSCLRRCIHQLNIVLAELNPGDKNPFITMERKSK